MDVSRQKRARITRAEDVIVEYKSFSKQGSVDKSQCGVCGATFKTHPPEDHSKKYHEASNKHQLALSKLGQGSKQTSLRAFSGFSPGAAAATPVIALQPASVPAAPAGPSTGHNELGVVPAAVDEAEAVVLADVCTLEPREGAYGRAAPLAGIAAEPIDGGSMSTSQEQSSRGSPEIMSVSSDDDAEGEVEGIAAAAGGTGAGPALRARPVSGQVAQPQVPAQPGRPAAQCAGYPLKLPAEAHSFNMNVPLQYMVDPCCAGLFTVELPANVLRSIECAQTVQLGGAASCKECCRLAHKTVVKGIEDRAANGAPPGTGYRFLGFKDLATLLHKKNSTVKYLKLQYLNVGRAHLALAKELGTYEHLMLALSENSVPRLQTILSSVMRRGGNVKCADDLFHCTLLSMRMIICTWARRSFECLLLLYCTFCLLACIWRNANILIAGSSLITGSCWSWCARPRQNCTTRRPTVLGTETWGWLCCVLAGGGSCTLCTSCVVCHR